MARGATDMVDVLVIGGGVVGCAILAALAGRQARLALVERDLDLCGATSKANSAIIHTGFDAVPGSLEATLLAASRAQWPHIAAERGIDYRRIGALLLATGEQEAATIENIIAPKAARNDVPVLDLSRREALARAPYVTPAVCRALLIAEEGIADPFRTVYAFAEHAVTRGAMLLLGRAVVAIEEAGEHLVVRLEGGETLRAGLVVNAAGLWADEVARLAGDRSFTLTGRKGQFMVTKDDPGLTHMILPVPSALSKGMLVTPAVFGGVLLGPTAEDGVDKWDTAISEEGLRLVREGAGKLVPALARASSIRQYAGVRAVSASGDYIIRFSEVCGRLLHVAGIRSTGLSASPAIGQHVAALVGERLGLVARRVAPPAVSSVAPHHGDGAVVCRCRGVTRGQIRATLAGPVPPTTLDGLKRRTGAMLGECQGNLCVPALTRLLAERQGHLPEAVERHARGSSPFLVRAATPPRPSTSWPPTMEAISMEPYDLAIVGAGLSALSALRAGVARGRTVVVEYQDAPSGALRTLLPAPGFEEAQDLLTGAWPPGNISLLTNTTAQAVRAHAGPDATHTIEAQGPAGALRLHARRIILACAGLEVTREHDQIPGTRPAGVITPVQAQQILDLGYLPGRVCLVYGAGALARATAWALRRAGATVLLAPPLDAGEVIESDIPVLPPARVLSLAGFPRLEQVMLRTADGTRAVPVDALIYARGLRADTRWLAGSGLALGPDGRIIVDGYFQTTVPGIHAIGAVVTGDIDHRRSIAMGVELAAAIAAPPRP